MGVGEKLVKSEEVVLWYALLNRPEPLHAGVHHVGSNSLDRGDS